jgi:hypothetical protein
MSSAGPKLPAVELGEILFAASLKYVYPFRTVEANVKLAGEAVKT